VRARLLAVVLGVVVALLVTSAATAKEFRPGDLRICGQRICVKITNQPVLNVLGAFYYAGPDAPMQARSPRLGAKAFELRFRNGYVTGIVATARLDRFLSYGVYLGRFTPRRWYRFPDRVARELRRLAAPLAPLRVTRRALAKSR
jgi:hypothetical protein